MRKPVSLVIPEPLFRRLHDHLFPGDGDEHGAIIAAGVAESSRGTRLLVRDVFLGRDGIEYVPSTRGYRALTAEFVAAVSGYCASEKLCYLSVHCHGGRDRVSFSPTDMASHERGYPALLDITKGGPVGALVFAEDAVAGDIWTGQGRYPLSHSIIIGPNIRRLYPQPNSRPPKADRIYDRHARLFGDIGQHIIGGLKVGIIGLGGGGSLLNEWLALLGVGHIVAVDFDRVDITNRPRIVGATWRDALSFLTESKNPFLQRLGRQFAKHKVKVAKRVARRAKPDIRYDLLIGNVMDAHVARHLADVDFLFLASDTMQSRLIFNALVYQYLIPGAQVGAKVSVDKNSRQLSDIFTASRIVLPYAGAGCLECHGLISPEKLREEALSERERRKQRYVDDEDVIQPSVVTLNALSAAPIINDFMLMFTGLFKEGVRLDHLINFVRERSLNVVESERNNRCPDCGRDNKSRRARGDRFSLPCRESSKF